MSSRRTCTGAQGSAASGGALLKLMLQETRQQLIEPACKVRGMARQDAGSLPCLSSTRVGLLQKRDQADGNTLEG